MRNQTRLLILLAAGTIAADTGLVGQWDFEEPLSPLAPTAGRSLGIVGSATPIAGPSPSDKAVLLAKGTILSIPHGMPVPVNSYSILLDLRIPSDGSWRSLFQTNSRNTDDADCFVKPDGSVGVMATGYSSPAIFAGKWHRLVVTVDNETSYRLYLDGRRILEGTPQPLGGRLTLTDTLLLFADDDGETDEIHLARVTLHSRALDSSEVAALGELDPATTAFSAGPWLQAVSDTSISVLWETNTSQPGWVEYGTTSALGSRGQAELVKISPQTNVQRARLGGLTPATAYRYRIASGSARSPVQEFRTAPSSTSARIRLGIWGDSHNLHPAKEMFAYMVDSLKVDFAVTTGDISNNGNDLLDLRATFLPLALQSIGSRVPFFAALGNHDVGSYSSPRIRGYLDQPQAINSDPTGLAGSYVAPYGPVAIVALDWNRLDTDIPGWLDRQLKSEFLQNFPFVFVFVHRAPYYERWQAAGEDATLRTNYPPVVEANRVQASFSGHMHGYERGFKNGTFYCTTGGSSYLDVSEPIGTDYPFITVGAFEAKPANFGLVNEFMTVDVDGARAIARMHAFDGSGQFLGILDSFEMQPRSLSLARPARSMDVRIQLQGRKLRAFPRSGQQEPFRLRLLDTRGRIALPWATGTREISLDLDGLTSGCYIVQVGGPSVEHQQSLCLP
ncbi:MAG: metallophosphoesterase [Fibrobacteres bacterium]|nr:metallophosphoesterase [Fibrobacterota bacterium]